MHYKLIGSNNLFSPIETILHNRGIENVEEYLNASHNPSVLNHYSKLKNIDRAVDCLMLHIQNESKIFVQVDSDADGYSSSAILIKYLVEQYPEINIQWRLHEGKEHGIEAENVPDDVGLVIVPDAGSSNYDEHKKLYDRGINTIVLDHHLTEKESEHAIVVNNQISPKFKNKHLSGAGIVAKFLEALDDKLKSNKAKNYYDLVALGIVGDIMDLRELENRYYVAQGMNNLNNPFLKTIFKEQRYSTKEQKNPTSLGWYISPLINATIRSGELDEKIQMFKALLADGEDDSFLVDTVKMMKNIRVRQNKLQTEGVELIKQRIKEKNLLNNKVLIVNVTDILDSNLSGLVANKLIEEYRRPVILLRYDEESNTLSGSARGYDKGAIKDFRQYLLDTGKLIYAEGHDNAFGVSGTVEKIIELNDYINKDLKDIEIGESVYKVDFVIPAKQLKYSLIKEIDNYKDLWGRGIEEPLITVQKVEIEKRNINLTGKNKNTIKFTYKDIDYIKFRADENDYENLISGDKTEIVVIDLIGRVSVNEWRGRFTGQVIIEDFEVVATKERELAF